MKKGTLLFAQSGGPTAVINASAAGVIREAQKCRYSCILCGKFGIDGVLSENFADVTKMSAKDLRLMSKTPSTAFGSCRHKLPSVEADGEIYAKLLEIFKKYDVTAFVYNGGNDSMDTCCKLSNYFKSVGYPCNVIGVPKTIDNDLACTDNCPGYGSAVKYVATTLAEIAHDTSAYAKGKITICEIMGRDSGFLTAGASLAKLSSDGVDLIYVPERPFDVDDFVKRATEIYEKKGRCLVALSEGIRDKDGNYISEIKTTDSFNHAQLGGVSHYLTSLIFEKYGIKTRAIELSLCQRAAAHVASLADYREALDAGKTAVKLASDGKTGLMVAFVREDGKIKTSAVDLNNVANAVKALPDEFIAEDGAGITEKFDEYALPLIQGEVKHQYVNGLPKYFRG